MVARSVVTIVSSLFERSSITVTDSGCVCVAFKVFLFHINNQQAAFKFAAQKSQVAATDIVFSTRHNNKGWEICSPASFIVVLRREWKFKKNWTRSHECRVGEGRARSHSEGGWRDSIRDWVERPRPLQTGPWLGGFFGFFFSFKVFFSFFPSFKTLLHSWALTTAKDLHGCSLQFWFRCGSRSGGRTAKNKWVAVLPSALESSQSISTVVSGVFRLRSCRFSAEGLRKMLRQMSKFKLSDLKVKWLANSPGSAVCFFLLWWTIWFSLVIFTSWSSSM